MEIWRRNLKARAQRLGITKQASRKIVRRRLAPVQSQRESMAVKVNSGLAHLFIGLCEQAAYDGNMDAYASYAKQFNAHLEPVLPRTRTYALDCKARIKASGIQHEIKLRGEDRRQDNGDVMCRRPSRRGGTDSN